mgnify:CR=1 FL=1|jgi:hypothetical protein
MSKIPDSYPGHVRKSGFAKSWNKHDIVVALCAVMGVIVVSVASVFVVRALLTDFTDEKQNEFYTMTYTNIEITEPNATYKVEFNIVNNEYVDHDHNGYVTKNAVITNLEGIDKKPVYLRVKVVTTVYDADGNNISMLYPNVQAYWSDFRNANPGYQDNEWTVLGDGYAYYYRILLPGDSTAALFKSDNEANKVRIFEAGTLPEGCTVHIDILADAVQAVSRDTVRWKAADYYKNESIVEVSNAWGRTPTPAAVSQSNMDSQVWTTCSWN